MKQKLTTSLLFALMCCLQMYEAAAQSVFIGNGWINFSQTYYKIPVSRAGIYRLSQAQLAQAGITGINPQALQLYWRGQEQAIRVEGEGDGSLDAGDYLEFYGQGNDGQSDLPLYDNDVSRMPNPYYNLYSDTTAYFLTWRLDGGTGRRMSTAGTTGGNITPYHWAEQLRVFSEDYGRGQNYPFGTTFQVYLSQFDRGEGWASNIAYPGQNIEVNIPISNLYTSDPTLQPRIEFFVIGAAFGSYNYDVRIGTSPSSLRLLTSRNNDITQRGTARDAFSGTLLMSDLSNGQLIVRFSPTKEGIRVAFVKISYPQTPNLGGQSAIITLPTNANQITLANAPANPVIYSINNQPDVRIVPFTMVGSNVQISLDNANPKLWVAGAASIITPSLQAVTFRRIQPNNFDYLLITHRRLRQSSTGGGDAIQAYADYRASVAGGGFKPLIVEVQELYDQFNYGEKSPLAIRRFAEFMYRNGTPRYMLLIGKGISLPDGYTQQYGLNVRQDPASYAKDLVPSYGFPPSDIAYTAGFESASPVAPAIPVGRLSVNAPDEVMHYLNKVKEHEAVGVQFWQKNIIQLSGGVSVDEQNLYRIFSAQFAQIAASALVYAQVFTSSKSTTAPVELINISGLVNAGVGLVTFFGHSSIGTTDLEIGFSSNDLQGYRNKGKYPMMLANGCQLASIFYDLPTLSEDWIHTPDRGAIGFMAHTFIGYSNPLRDYTRQFYRTAFQDPNLVGKPIGDIMRKTIQERATTFFNQEEHASTAQQMLLQGDPAVKFFKADKPDYFTADNMLYLESFDSNPVSAVSDSFKLQIITGNAGIFNPARLKVRVRRTYPNGTQTEMLNPVGYAPINYKDTLTFVIRAEAGQNAFGTNVFEVMLDYDNSIVEMREDNNSGRLSLFMPAAGVTAALPLEYSIVNENPVLLTALANNALTQNRSIIFELDTAATFNSPIKMSTIVPPSTNATWEVSLPIQQDSTVYYWRVNYADADPNSNRDLWGESSFVYIKNSPDGWSQSRFPQFSKATITNLQRNTFAQRWEFDARLRHIAVKTYGSNFGGNYITDVGANFDGLPVVFGGNCQPLINISGVPTPQATITAMAFDQNSGDPYLVLNDPSQCGRAPRVANTYNNTELANNRLLNYLNNVRPGDYVLFFTAGNINFSTWTAAQRSAFAAIGGNPAIYNQLQNGHPYIILGRKGAAPGSAAERIGNTSSPADEAITLTTTIQIDRTEGSIASTRIGPAKKWKELIHDIRRSGADQTRLDLYGISLNGQETATPLVSDISLANLNLSAIDAAQYPYLRLKLNLRDNVQRTPALLRKWLVLYDGVPEGFLNPDAFGFSTYNITRKQEGESIPLRFSFKNISNLTFTTDSLDVRYTITNLETLQQRIETRKIKSPAPKASTEFNYTVNTQGLGGRNRLEVFVNPRLVPEVFYENNVINVNFEVNADRVNPLLEVAFDGKRIIDGEIVSPSPLITVILKDNNPYLPIADPSKLQLALKRPCAACALETINLNAPNVRYVSTGGELRVELKLDNLSNGIYTLQAQGKDAVGNAAGIQPYRINFEVVEESSVTNVYPYPNPFSTGTRFVFTLTGREIPDEMKIQIMTVSGKVVREITQSEIGGIRIGQNISEYTWDGTDEFGDKLANGVYLYRVIMRSGGKPIQGRATAGDQAFKNGIGKLYIAR